MTSNDDQTSEPGEELHEELLAALRDLPPVSPERRDRQIAEAVRHLPVDQRHSGGIRRGVLAAAAVVIVAVGVVSLVRAQGSDDLKASSVESMQSGDRGDAASAGVAADKAERPAASITPDAPPAPVAGEVANTPGPPTSVAVPQRSEAASVSLGEFPTDEAARQAMIARFGARDSAVAGTSSPPAAEQPCPPPPGGATVVAWATAIVAGRDRVVVMVTAPDATMRAWIADPAVCVWS